MSKSLPERMRALASSALHLAPGWCACAAAAFTPPVFTLPLLLLGNALRAGGSPRDAAQALETALERDPALNEARSMLADCYHALGEDDKASRVSSPMR